MFCNECAHKCRARVSEQRENKVKKCSFFYHGIFFLPCHSQVDDCDNKVLCFLVSFYELLLMNFWLF